jgi:acetolactate synthase-1/2/3 large subunit
MTLSGALIVQTLRAAGVTHLFANFGSDHPAIIEALAADREQGIMAPAVILCPHEYTALSAAHAYAAVTGRPQAVFVHTDVGTANLGGAVHNAARSRVPVFIFAGLTPYTLEGELPGTRNTVVNHLQDAPDQHALVRQYVKWSYDLRTGRNAPQVVHRALQLAVSAPAGPVYVTGAREVLGEDVPDPGVGPSSWPTIARLPASKDVVDSLVRDLTGAEHPLILTSYLGRRQGAVGRLVELAERLAIPVVEVSPEVLNFPHDHPLHLGDDPLPLLAESDVIVAVDTDAPWMPVAGRPRDDATVYVIGDDPLQERLPLWYLPAAHVVRADSEIVLSQVLEALATEDSDRPDDAGHRATRSAALRERSRLLRAAWAAQAQRDVDARALTSASVAHVLEGMLNDDTIVLNETISEASTVWRQLHRSRPGTLFGNRGTSLGWSGGGALGVKLAVGERTVVSLVGDGTDFFGVPASAFWVADRYRLPVLTVILDNGGWNATKRNLRLQHDGMVADRTDRYWVNLQQTADLAGIATAAGHAWGATVTTFDELDEALQTGLAHVAAGRPAVVHVRLAPISRQVEDALPAAP